MLNNIFGIISEGLSWGVVIMRSCNVLHAGWRIKGAATDSNLNTIQKTHNIGTNLVYGTAQMAAFGPFSTDIKFGAQAAASILGVAKSWSNAACDPQSTADARSFISQFGLTVVVDLGGNARAIRPNFLGQEVETFAMTAEAIGAVVYLLAHSKEIVRLSGAVRDRWNRGLPTWNSLRRLRIPFEASVDKNTGEASYGISKESYDQFMAASKARTAADIKEILDVFADSVYNDYVCAITKVKIRTPYAVSGTTTTCTPVYFEEAAILQWLSQHPKKPPEGWKQSGVAYKRSNLIKDVWAQGKIDAAIERDLEWIRNTRFALSNEDPPIAEPPNSKKRKSDEQEHETRAGPSCRTRAKKRATDLELALLKEGRGQ